MDGLDEPAYLAGELSEWPQKEQLAELLKQAGLRVYVGRYSVRVDDCSHFVFQEYGGDLGPPEIEADASSSDEMVRGAGLVSSALARAGLRHRFEVYDANDVMVAYLHHQWPQATSERPSNNFGH